MNAQATRPSWADSEIRLNPYALPQRVAYCDGTARAEFTLNSGGAVLKRDMRCGLPLSMALPHKAFKGVAARAFDNKDGTSTVTLELLHADPALSVPLCVADTAEDAACDWHSWARKTGLPMLLLDENGVPSVVKDANAIVIRDPKPRRRRFTALKHRPKFLRRRKVGSVGPVVRISAREIIARN
ncbi:MAG: DUF6101 family protein [Ahrensia sp.]|nr:DUF6101 family protein [Ahrensia sp.]